MERQNNEQLVTRAGLKPSMAELPFTIDTDMVESHLQKKFDVLCKKLSSNGDSDVKDIKIQLYTTEAGKYFLPFILVMPEDVLVDSKTKSYNTPDIFNPKESDGTARIRNEFVEMLRPFVYNKDDKKAFFADSWRHQMGITRQSANAITRITEPKMITMNHGRIRNVVVLIDPIRVFHDMLMINGNSDRFTVDIDGWKKLNSGRYKYSVKRSVTKNSKNYKNTFYNELNARIRGGN